MVPMPLALASSFANVNALTPTVVQNIIDATPSISTTSILKSALDTSIKLQQCLLPINRKENTSQKAADAFLNKTFKADCDGMCAEVKLQTTNAVPFEKISKYISSESYSPKDAVALKEKLYKELKNSLITSYWAIKSAYIRPVPLSLIDAVSEVTTITDDKATISSIVDIKKIVQHEGETTIANNRANLFKTTNVALTELDTTYKKLSELKSRKRELLKIKDALVLPAALPAPSPLSFSQLDIKPRLNQIAQDKTAEAAIALRFKAQDELLKKGKAASKNDEFAKKEYERVLSEGRAAQVGFTESKKTKYYLPEFFTSRAAVTGEVFQVENEEAEVAKRYVLLQQNLKNNPLLLGSIGEKRYHVENLLTYGAQKGLTEKQMSSFLDKHLNATKDLTSDLDEWYQSEDPEEFLQKAIYLNPNIAATILSENPSLAPLLCHIASKIKDDNLFKEKMERTLAIATVIASGALVISTLGTAAAGLGALSLVIGGVGGVALGASSATHNIIKGREYAKEAEQVRNFFVSRGEGSPQEIDRLLDLAKKRYISAAIDLGLTALDLGLFFKTLSSLKSIKELKVIAEVKNSQEFVKAAKIEPQKLLTYQGQPQKLLTYKGETPKLLTYTPRTTEHLNPLRAKLDRGEFLTLSDVSSLSQEDRIILGFKIIGKDMGPALKAERPLFEKAMREAAQLPQGSVKQKIKILREAGIKKDESVYALIKSGIVGEESTDDLVKNIGMAFAFRKADPGPIRPPSRSAFHENTFTTAQVQTMTKNAWQTGDKKLSSIIHATNVSDPKKQALLSEVGVIAKNMGLPTYPQDIIVYAKSLAQEPSRFSKMLYSYDETAKYVLKNAKSKLSVFGEDRYVHFLANEGTSQKGLAVLVNGQNELVEIIPAKSAKDAVEQLMRRRLSP